MVQGFCPLKVEIIQFPDGFCRKLFVYICWEQTEKHGKICKRMKGQGRVAKYAVMAKKKQTKKPVLQLDKTKVSLKL